MSILRNCKKILAIGRNYSAHIDELKNARPAQPFFFLKPSTSIVEPGKGSVEIPKGVTVHFEVELALVMGKRVKNLDPETSEKDILDLIEGYAVAIDMTARNVQDEAKKKGLPWSAAKGKSIIIFSSTNARLRHILPNKSRIPDPHDCELYLNVNGEAKQSDSTNLMLFRIPRLLSHLSSIMTIEPGDLVLTGTPKGVGPVVQGDVMTAGIRVNGKELEEGKIKIPVTQAHGLYSFSET